MCVLSARCLLVVCVVRLKCVFVCACVRLQMKQRRDAKQRQIAQKKQVQAKAETDVMAVSSTAERERTSDTSLSETSFSEFRSSDTSFSEFRSSEFRSSDTSAGGSTDTGARPSSQVPLQLLSGNLAPVTQVMALPSADVTVHNLRPLKDAAHFAGRARGVLRCRVCKKKCYFYCVTCSPDPTKPAGLVALCGLATERACFTTHKQGACLHGHSAVTSS